MQLIRTARMGQIALDKYIPSLGNLINTLLNLGRVDDAKRAALDSDFHKQLYQELQIA